MGFHRKVGGDALLKLFGCSKMVIDEFTPASDVKAYQTQLNHSLGEVPKMAFVIPKEDFTHPGNSNAYIVQAYMNYSIDIYNSKFPYLYIKRYAGQTSATGSTNGLNNSYKPTSNTILVGDSDYLRSGVTYQIITMV